jgi:hypothetical protein
MIKVAAEAALKKRYCRFLLLKSGKGGSRLPFSPPGSVVASVAYATEVATGDPQLGRRFCLAAEIATGNPRPFQNR